MSKISAFSTLLRGAATAALITAFGILNTGCGSDSDDSVDSGPAGDLSKIVSVVANDPSASEDGDTGEFTISLTEATTDDLEVMFTLTGTATLGDDYTVSPATTATIPAGTNSVLVTIMPLPDSLEEGDETVTLEITLPDGYMAGGNGTSADVTIIDVVDPSPRISVVANDPSASENGDTGQFTISLMEKTTVDLEVTFTLSGTATLSGAEVVDGDYTANYTSSVTIAAGSKSALVTITPSGDLLEEGNETVTLEVTVPADYTGVGSMSADVTITDVVALQPTISVIASDPSGSEDGDTAAFSIRLAQTTPVDLVVSIALAGTATIDDDYSVDQTTTVTIPAESNRATVTITPAFDAVTEGNENVTLSVVTIPEGYEAGVSRSATVTILDVIPQISVVSSTDTIREGEGPAQFTIELSHITPADLEVSFDLSGTATLDADYNADFTRIVTVPAGSKTAAVTIVPRPDELETEGPETVSIDVVVPGNYQEGSSLTAVVEIEDVLHDVVIGDLDMTLKGIRGGAFTMGRPSNDSVGVLYDDPQHEVEISSDFWVCSTETTVEQFQVFLKTAVPVTDSAAEADQSPADTGVVAAAIIENPAEGVNFDADYCPLNSSYGLKFLNLYANLDKPMVGITRQAAVNFCLWLTDREMANDTIPVGYEFRLPTEAEWEYSCRAGTTTIFYYGDDEPIDVEGSVYGELGDHAWYSENCKGIRSVTQIVGQEKTVNQWGLHDMSGNVAEFCYDFLGDYPAESQLDPLGAETGFSYVLRGGSFTSAGSKCRSANRSAVTADQDSKDMGFRVVLAPRID